MKNLVALLLASYISTEQFAYFSAKAESAAAEPVKGKAVDGQAVQVDEDERSDSDSDDDKQNVEEESDSGSDSDSGDDDGEKKEKESEPKAAPKPAATPTQSLVEARDQFGRDAKGNYLDQPSYVKKRNELNQKEESHRAMYNSVTEKLEDPVYVVNALQTASSVDQQV